MGIIAKVTDSKCWTVTSFPWTPACPGTSALCEHWSFIVTQLWGCIDHSLGENHFSSVGGGFRWFYVSNLPGRSKQWCCHYDGFVLCPKRKQSSERCLFCQVYARLHLFLGHSGADSGHGSGPGVSLHSERDSPSPPAASVCGCRPGTQLGRVVLEAHSLLCQVSRHLLHGPSVTRSRLVGVLITQCDPGVRVEWSFCCF